MFISKRMVALIDNLNETKTYRLDPTAPPFSVKPLKPADQHKPANQHKPVRAAPKPERPASASPGSRPQQPANRPASSARQESARQKTSIEREVQIEMQADIELDDIVAEVYVAMPFEREQSRRRRPNPEQYGDASSAEELELDLIGTQMEQLSGSNGVFEILLPGGKTLGVVVDRSASHARFLLSPGDEKQRARLQRHQMELEHRLALRIGTDARITVL